MTLTKLNEVIETELTRLDCEPAILGEHHLIMFSIDHKLFDKLLDRLLVNVQWTTESCEEAEKNQTDQIQYKGYTIVKQKKDLKDL